MKIPNFKQNAAKFPIQVPLFPNKRKKALNCHICFNVQYIFIWLNMSGKKIFPLLVYQNIILHYKKRIILFK